MKSRIRAVLSDLLNPDLARQARLTCLGGHASLRIYWRIHLPAQTEHPYPRHEQTLMAMVFPEDRDPTESAEATDAKAASDTLPFADVQRFLQRLGVPVPDIDRIDLDRGVLLLEDLGDRCFEDAVLDASSPDAITDLYQQALDRLIGLQASLHHRDDPPQTIALQRHFDASLLQWEFDHYLEWGLQARLELDDESWQACQRQFQPIKKRLVDALSDLPQTLVLRDFQSRTIMHKNDQWVLSDFQDALVGPCIYDVVALLRDSYIELPHAQADALVHYYADAGRHADLPWCLETKAVRQAFYLQTVQRKLKDAGRFINIDRVKNNPDFLPYYDASIGYVRHAVEQLQGFDDLHEALHTWESAW